MAEKITTRRYVVQFVVIHEIEVESHDDIAAEKEAFHKLRKCHDQENAIAALVLEPRHGGGAIQSDDDMRKNWEFARNNFGAIDKAWVNS